MWNMLLQTVLRMSLIGSVVILAVLFARVLLCRTPKIFSYLLWGVVLLRLLCPVSFSTYLSLLQFVEVPVEEEQIGYGIQNFVRHQNTELAVSANKTAKQVSKTTVSAKSNSDSSFKIFTIVGTVVWFAGIAVIVTYGIISLIRLRRQLIGAVRLKDNIYLTDYVSSAFVLGIWKPRIYLPAMLSDSEQEYIILHEQVHIRRKDYLSKILAFTALAIHWFNPLVWLAFRLSDKDMEMSCDEAVMKKMNRDIRAEYSASLLKLAADRKILSETLPAFGEGETGSRIKHILRYKKPTIASVLAATVILASTVVVAGSNPKVQDTGSKNQDSASSFVTVPKNTALDKNISDKEAFFKDNFNKSSSAENGSEQSGIVGNQYADSVSAVERKPGETWEQSIGVNEDFAHTMECAYLRSMAEDTLEVDPIEYIDGDTDPQRLKELGITKEYLNRMDGYEFNNPDEDTILWKIDENTEFIFADWGRDFIIEEIPCNSIMVKTKDRELFRSYLATYKNSKPGMPFFFEVEDGVVKRLVEKLFA